MSLWLVLPASAQTDDYLKQARSSLEYYLADNTPDLEFRRGLDPDQANAALALVEKHLALHTRDDAARAWGALAYTSLGATEDALAEIERALESGLAGAAWLNLAGDIQFERGDLSSALDYYSRAALQKKNPWHQWDVARTLDAIGPNGGQAAWDKLITDYPQSSSAWLEHGWHAYELGDYATADADYREAITIKDTAEAHNRLAILLVNKGDLPGAEAQYMQAIAIEASPQLYANLIERMLARNALTAELEPLYAELLTKFPDDPYAQRVNGDRLRAAGNPQAALEAYKRAGDDRYALNAIGNCLFDLQRFAEAEASYRTALDSGYDATVIGNIAGAMRAQGKLEEERNWWAKHVALHGDETLFRQNYGDALFKAEMFEEALQQYQSATRHGYGNADLDNQTGLTLLQLGRHAEAADEFKAAAAQDAQVVYFSNAGYALGLAGEWHEAEVLYRGALQKFPNDANLSSGLGEALAAQGRSGEAAGAVLDAAESAEVISVPVNSSAAVAGSASAIQTEVPEALQVPQEAESAPANDAPPQAEDELPVARSDELSSTQGTTEPSEAELGTDTDPATQAKLYAEAARHAAAAGNIEQAISAYADSFAAQPDLDVAADWGLLLAEQSRGVQIVNLVAAVKNALGAPYADKLVDRLGRFYLERKDHAGGAALMERLIEADPRAATPYNQLAMVQAAQRAPQAALATVKRGLN
ncbi:MAG: tetratricopeptide repeat protein, partial [bacterium]|nr:tetratricopeptide repeat protein [bacterium]